MRSLLLFFAVICIFTCHGQWSPYKFSYQLDSIIKADSDESHPEIQDVGTSYSWIGNYQKALDIFKYYGMYQLDDEHKAAFQKYHPEPAVKYILEQAKNAKVIIINEGHHLPLHRVFMEGLLQGLREEGFDILGMETFDDGDSTIRSRAYPTMSSGWYSSEPCYGNMIRKALKLNYKLFGYETKGGGQREVKQAENIVQKLKENPNSKFIIYCGYDHLIKDTMPGADSWRHAMAGWLKLMTGIDALTINQVVLTETGKESWDNPYRGMIHADHDVVMVNDSGSSLRPKTKYNADISVYHPDTKYIHGRPDWQIPDDKRTENINNKITIGFPCLAFVYRAGEDYDKAVPTDVIEIETAKDDVHVILEKKYKNIIILKNPQGQKQVIPE